MEYIDFRSVKAEAGVWPDAATLPFAVIMPCQTHSCNVAVIEADGEYGEFPDTDALVSFRKDIAIGVRTADCVPVLLHAPDIEAVAAIHAGWKGTIGGLVSRAVELLVSRGADPAEMQAAFGPSICGRCYEVSPEMAGEFRAAGYAACVTGERNLDLEAVNRARLEAAGLLPGNIRPSKACTYETHALPSWRRTGGTSIRLVSWIRLLGGGDSND